MEYRHIRLVSVGSETLAGVGDSRALGWLGRVLAKTQTSNADLQSYVLAQPGENTEELSHRWETEVLSRFEMTTENRLVVALSQHDADISGSSARSRLNLANIIDRATQQNIDVFVIGPVPTLDDERNQKLQDLNSAYHDVAQRRGVHYVDAFSQLLNHEQWRSDLAAGQGYPGQAGYGLIAWLVLHRGWYQWLQLPEPTE